MAQVITRDPRRMSDPQVDEAAQAVLAGAPLAGAERAAALSLVAAAIRCADLGLDLWQVLTMARLALLEHRLRVGP